MNPNPQSFRTSDGEMHEERRSDVYKTEDRLRKLEEIVIELHTLSKEKVRQEARPKHYGVWATVALFFAGGAWTLFHMAYLAPLGDDVHQIRDTVMEHSDIARDVLTRLAVLEDVRVNNEELIKALKRSLLVQKNSES